MKDSEYVDWEAETKSPKINDGARQVLDHFNPPDVGNLEFKTLSPELANEYKAVSEKIKALTEIQAMLRANILKLADAEKKQDKKWAIPVGDRTINFTRRAGAATVDYEKFIEDQIGKDALDELQAEKEMVKKGVGTSKYISVGTGSIAVEVR